MTVEPVTPADYWKLPTHRFPFIVRGEKEHPARKALLERGVFAPHKATLGRLLKLLERSDRNLLYYGSCSIEELQLFVKARGAQYPKRNRTRQETLIALLEKIDDNARFEKMLDLPAELRVYIYEFYFAGLSHGTGLVPVRPQPPLMMVCRLLRREASDIFPTVCTLNPHFYGFNAILKPPPELRKELAFTHGSNLPATINRFKKWHIHLSRGKLSMVLASIIIHFPTSLSQGKSSVDVRLATGPFQFIERGLKSAKAAQKAKEALDAIIEAVSGREDGVEWRERDFRDVAGVLQVLLREG